MKRSSFSRYPSGSSEYVYLHGLWQMSRGRNFSATLSGVKDPRKAFRLARRYFQTHGCLSVAVVNGVVYIGELMGVPGFLVRARIVRLNEDATPCMLAETGIYYPGKGQYIGSMEKVEENPIPIGSIETIQANMDIWREWYDFHSWGNKGKREPPFGIPMHEMYC